MYYDARQQIGTILNAAGILLGGILGLTLSKQLSSAQQVALKGLLGVFTVYVGLKTTWMSLGGGMGTIMKQLAILLFSLILGRITGRLLHLQKSMNRLGQFAIELVIQRRERGKRLGRERNRLAAAVRRYRCACRRLAGQCVHA